MRDRGARFLLPMQKISRHSDEIPTTHTPCSPTHHPSRNKQVRPTSTARARSPQDTEYSSSISRFFFPSHSNWYSGGQFGHWRVRGRCSHALVGGVAHFGPPSFASLVGLTTPLPEAQGLGLFDNAMLRGAAPFKPALTYSRTTDSSVL